MIRIAAALVVAVTANAAVAEDTMQHAQRIRREGIGVSLAAVGCEIATVALWGGAVGIISSARDHGEYTQEPSYYWPVVGFAVATSAVVPLLLGIGIPMWAVGSHRVNVLRAGRLSLSSTGVTRF